MLPKIAILLAAYNGQEWICDQVNSLIKQQNVDLKIFISIDLSMDNTLHILCQLQKKYNNIIILPYGEKFGGAAKNFYRLIKDVDFSSYDYVALSDQDDIWFPNKLESGISKIIQTNSCAYSSDVVAFWSNGRTKYIKKSHNQKKYDFVFESAGPGCTYILDVKSLINFKDKLTSSWAAFQSVEYHDWIIYFYYRLNNIPWIIDSSSFMYYRQHGKNQLGANASLGSFFTRIKMIRSGWYLDQIRKISDILNFQMPSKYFIIRNIFNIRRGVVQSLFLSILLLIT